MIDEALKACIEFGEVPFGVENVKRVLATIEGDPEGRDWQWVVRLRDGRTFYLRGRYDDDELEVWAGAVELPTRTALARAVCQLRGYFDTDEACEGYTAMLSEQMEATR